MSNLSADIYSFSQRHIGPNASQIPDMLSTTGAASLDELIEQAVPADIRLSKKLNLPVAEDEYGFINRFKKLAGKNKVFRSYIGLGYYNTITPAVIQRNILENPGWYTAYTPYQSEIAQGRLEALVNFQTMVADLTGMDIANASLLDEATAAGEAMTMMYALRPRAKAAATKFIVSDLCFPQTIEVLKTRSAPLGLEVVVCKIDESVDLSEAFGMLLQYPDRDGAIVDYSEIIGTAHQSDVMVCMAADILSLALLKSPGELGADVAIGSTQRFGVPMGFGGPHAAYFATKENHKRFVPGRIIGASVDAAGKTAYRMALQTREQHIKRERATSNICTSQVLLAVMAGMYAVYHGPKGIKGIASRISKATAGLALALEDLGFKQLNLNFFDTIKIDAGEKVEEIKAKAVAAGINFRYEGQYILISLDETVSADDLEQIVEIFTERSFTVKEREAAIPEDLVRQSTYLQHPVFNNAHSEHEMLRYLKKLENKDLSLVHSMIPLGSCTMKLNATTEMLPVSWPEMANIHPFVPDDQCQGYMELFEHLENWLSEITGFSAVSLQPNSGAQGEYAGLMVIKAYHDSKGEEHRNIALIPSSAHGTNPASAVLAGMKVVTVKCDEKGNIDVEDLTAKVAQHGEKISCLMVTYPSTHGVFETTIRQIINIVHDAGGQVYMDGANMNAQVGLTSPGEIGADVCHLNLHKTFCIPHGGGGPGMGPIGVAKHLAPYLPGHTLVPTGGENAVPAVSAAPFGSSLILPISYAYISMMGGEGLKNATVMAILNANYLMSRLKGHYPLLYTGTNGRCAHEFILDCREFKQSAGIEVEDIAKRLIDYGFHSPTVSFPVPGTLMIEPTESESKAELDRFAEAMIAIRSEIKEIEQGVADKDDNVLKKAPHTAEDVTSDEWNRPYSRSKAAFPLPWVKETKFWPSASRIDNAYGDRNLFCACVPIEAYKEEVN
ncbi:aminomethyl-transferring glycine dehydrogenase [Cytophagaceae bacterium ABcell3]|nr:aminomethyl-transferring glycine dehydrogenase [Cytophagaceae bacterium ABcell3]